MSNTDAERLRQVREAVEEAEAAMRAAGRRMPPQTPEQRAAMLALTDRFARGMRHHINSTLDDMLKAGVAGPGTAHIIGAMAGASADVLALMPPSVRVASVALFLKLATAEPLPGGRA